MAMRSAFGLVLAVGAAALLAPADAGPAWSQTSGINEKINAYIACINRLSERSYDSRRRYFSWVSKNGPTGKERIIYGLYTIYDTTDCKKKVVAANAMEPHDADLEKAAADYADAVGILEGLLKEADDYYSQENYKDDKMAKGRAMHSTLVAAWEAFANADQRLRVGIDELQDAMAGQRIAEIERTEGLNDRYHIEAVMLSAKRLMRAQSASQPDLAAMSKALEDYEAILKATETHAAVNKGGKISSGFISTAKSYLTTAKQLMRRVRDKVPYSQGDKMMLDAGGGWMVEGSPARLTRDYNQLVESYNRGARF
jgi:hypothetical protein